MHRIYSFIIALILLSNCISATTISFEKTGVKVVHKRIVKEVKTYLGYPYIWGDTGSKGFDCSGLVFRVFSDIVRLVLPREVEALKKEGTMVKEDLVSSDLVFFDTSGKGKATHVGIYIGENKFIHSASAGRKQGVIVSSLTEKYYKIRYLGARRLIKTGFPCVKIEINDKKSVKAIYPGELLPNIPVYLSITNVLHKPVFIEVIAFRDKKPRIVKRMQLPDKGDPTVLSFVPDQGRWSVMVKGKDDKKLALIALFHDK